ncbi:ABC transporter ATP-binding protein [Streptomyces sp. NPDC001130]
MTGASHRKQQAQPSGEPSSSEKLLFGGELEYDLGWNQHRGAWLKLGMRTMAASLPRQIAIAVRLARQADPRALYVLAAAEIGRGVTQAVSLVAVNRLLTEILAAGTTVDRLRGALPSMAFVAVMAVLGSMLHSASTAATGMLEPKVQRVATERYLGLVARVEMKAVEDDAFHKLMDSAQWGADSARRMVKYSTTVVNAAISLITAAGVLTVLHPVMLPLLTAMALPSAWGSLEMARQRYTSWQRFVQHARAAQLLSQLLIDQKAAGEVRVHNVGPFLLEHFHGMAETSEREQTRLAWVGARTGLTADAARGLATLATYGVLGLLLWNGSMPLAVGGTAVLAIRTGSTSINNLVLTVADVQEESLFVADLDRLCTEAERQAIPATGRDVPSSCKEVRFENVTFTYHGADQPSLRDVDLVFPLGKTIALVGRNGSGKTTLTKLLSGLYLPDSGRIVWGDVDAAQARRASIFARIAMVAQDFQRWPFTARVNIGIGSPGSPIDDALVDAAAAYSGADEVLAKLLHGKVTLLVRGYQGGQDISGGQWQKVGLARARYRTGRDTSRPSSAPWGTGGSEPGADILIVDEPTSALDPESEQRVFDQIHRLAGTGQTTVLVTHRLHSVRHADLIYVLDEGRVVEHGTFDQLMDPDLTGGIFRRVYERQAQQFQTAQVPEQSGVPAPAMEPAGEGAE